MGKGEKTYSALMLFNMKASWFNMSNDERDKLSKEHIADLYKFTDQVRISHMAGTGLSKYDLIVQLESDNLSAMDEMMNSFKAGRKAEQGVLQDIIVMEKGLGRI